MRIDARGAGMALVSTLVSAGILAAQEVSPRAYATQEGPFVNTSTTTNFMTRNVGRFQQLHGDMRGKARMIDGLAFRRDGTSTSTTGTARTITVDVFMGHGNYASATTTFASNFSSAPTQVMTMQMVNLPDWSAAPTMAPQPFDASFMTTAFAYDGAQDFIWEVVVYANTATTSRPTDSAGPVVNPSTVQVLSSGCIAAGQSTDMALSPTASNFEASSEGTFTYTFSVSGAPPFAPQVWVFWGFSNPDLLLPGACSRIYSSADLIVPLPAATSTGASSRDVVTKWNNTFAGLRLYLQAVAPDASQGAVPFALSTGLQVTLPGGVPPPAPVRLLTATTNTATTGTFQSASTTSPLVTRFDN